MKSPAFATVMRPVRERERQAMERHSEAMKGHEVELAQYKKALSLWKNEKNSDDLPPMAPELPRAERFIVSDTTIEALAPILLANPRGLLLSRDELAGWIGSFDRYAGGGGSDASQWLSTYNGDSLVVDRKTGFPPTLYVPQAFVSITGGIQPGILHRALGARYRDSGLAARLLMACPPRKPKRWTDEDIDSKTEAEIARMDSAQGWPCDCPKSAAGTPRVPHCRRGDRSPR